MKPMTEARGVRNSWLALATKSARMAFGVALFGLVMQQQKDKVRLGATNRFAGQMDRCHPRLIDALAVALERIFNLAHRAAINNVV